MIQNIVNSIVLCVAVLFAISAYGEVPDQVSTQPEVSAGKKLEARLLDAELQRLEEDLLYPASSRVAVYLSMVLGELFALDAMTVKLNGKDVTHHLYME
jgi:hypothetical protein